MMAFLMGLKSVSAGEVQELAEKRAATIVDVNSQQSWDRAHVPGAKHLDAAAFTQSDLPADKDASLVFYCGNPMCSKAPRAAKRAKAMGYNNVRVMSAGISGWVADKRPVETGQTLR
jgi:rhodanese-related sulfurtransferase